MSRTTFQIGATLASEFPGKQVKHLLNFGVKEPGAVEAQIAGVMVRYQVSDQNLEWCYI